MEWAPNLSWKFCANGLTQLLGPVPAALWPTQEAFWLPTGICSSFSFEWPAIWFESHLGFDQAWATVVADSCEDGSQQENWMSARSNERKHFLNGSNMRQMEWAPNLFIETEID